MDRRTFLKRSGAGAIAACAALRWRAPERLPEPEDVAEVGASQEPTWWAECEIDGVRHRVEQITGPVVNPEPVEYWDFCGEERPPLTELIKTRDIDMVLWAEDSRFLQVLDLVANLRQVHVAMRLPDRLSLGRVHFDGFFIAVTEPNSNYHIPAFDVTMRMTGAPEWRG